MEVFFIPSSTSSLLDSAEQIHECSCQKQLQSQSFWNYLQGIVRLSWHLLSYHATTIFTKDWKEPWWLGDQICRSESEGRGKMPSDRIRIQSSHNRPEKQAEVYKLKYMIKDAIKLSYILRAREKRRNTVFEPPLCWVI